MVNVQEVIEAHCKICNTKRYLAIDLDPEIYMCPGNKAHQINCIRMCILTAIVEPPEVHLG